MHHLPRAVNAGIGAARTEDAYRFIRYLRERFLQLLLDAAHLILPLPAIVFTAIVFNAEGNSVDRLLFHI